MDKIRCVKCETEKETPLFPVNKRVRRGFDSWCKECHKQYGKQHRNENIDDARQYQSQWRRTRRDWLQSLKNKPCKDCGKEYEPHCMDFDHLSDKVIAVSGMISKNTSKNKIIEEIQKCDLVCILCHNTRTQKRLDEKSPIKKYSKCSIRNIEIINQAKNIPCKICSKLYESHNMHLDHVNPTEKFKNISQLKSFKLDTLLKELEKCQVLCALCHRRKSIWEQQADKYQPRAKLLKIKPMSNSEKGIKECSKCNSIKKFEFFAIHLKTKDGYNSWCRDCFNQYRRERRK